MGLFDFFKGKDPVKHEEQGDRYYEAAGYGQARIEYEAALVKRRREMPNDVKIPELENRIVQCKEALAREHKTRGDNLAEAGDLEDALEYYTLAQDLTQDTQLNGDLENCLRTIERLQLDVFRRETPDADTHRPENLEQSIHESEDEYAEALFNTLPDNTREVYLNYGANFENGYIALHQGRFNEAVEYLSQALEENSGPDSFVRLELAMAYLNLKRFEEARTLLEDFILHHPEVFPAYRMLCEMYWETDLFDRAKILLSSLSDDQMEQPEFCLLRGETLFRTGDTLQAESLYLNFLTDCCWNKEVAQALARTYEVAGKLPDAQELYSKIIGSCGSCRVPVDPLILRKYADLSMVTGIQNEKILEIYLSLAEQDPDNAAGYYKKVSQIYATLGHEKESKRFRLIALDYEDGSNPGN